MRRAIMAMLVVAVAQGTGWAQLSDAPAGTQLTGSFHIPLEGLSPALLAQSSTTISTGSVPCGRIRAVPASAVAEQGSLPNAPSAYGPLSRHCKFELVLRQTYSPYTLASAAYDATWAQIWSQWPQYGGGMQGWGKRLGATLADVESRRFIQNFVLASALHEDPRYFESGKRGLISRGWYAATRVLVTRDDYGRNVLNQSELLGASLTSSLQDAYYPRPDRTFGATVNRFAGSLSSDATANVLKEFTPDLKRLFHKHCPQGIQRLEARMPIPENMKP
jgi:hypothetical protein